MGYISFSKGGGEVDLLPAENIIHVTSGGTTDCKIVYGVFAKDDIPLEATVVISSAEASATSIRNAVNTAIEKANGASGPAIPVAFANTVTSVTPTLGPTLT